MVLLFEKIGWEVGASTKKPIELFVTKTNDGVIFNGTTIIDFFNVGPENGG